MKVTIDVPDDLYLRVKAQAALRARTVRDVSVELFRRWLGDLPPDAPEVSTTDWVREWVAMGAQATAARPTTTTARDELEADRKRLEPKP
jgi:hypothetical protein